MGREKGEGEREVLGRMEKGKGKGEGGRRRASVYSQRVGWRKWKAGRRKTQ